MVRYVVYQKSDEKGDRSLIDHMFKWAWVFPGFVFEKDGFKDSLKEPGVDKPLSLTIKSRDGKLIAAIPEDEPFKILLFDKNRLRFITEMVGGLSSTRAVLIEIQ